MIAHIEMAAEALQAFAAYAENMEKLPHVNGVLVLRLFSDGSGRICASGDKYRSYLEFSDLEDLLQQLKKETL